MSSLNDAIEALRLSIVFIRPFGRGQPPSDGDLEAPDAYLPRRLLRKWRL